MFGRKDLEDAGRIVYAAMPPTPQYAWPLLGRETVLAKRLSFWKVEAEQITAFG